MITDRQSVFFPERGKSMFKSCLSALFRPSRPAGINPADYFADPPVLETADLILRPGFAFLWIPASLFGALGLFVFWLPAFRDATDDFVTLKV